MLYYALFFLQIELTYEKTQQQSWDIGGGRTSCTNHPYDAIKDKTSIHEDSGDEYIKCPG